MKVTLDFDTSGLEIEVPEACLAGVLESREMIAAPYDAVRTALESPVACAPLREMAQGRRRACIVISDHTRPVPNRPILEPILAVLHEAGLRADDVLILVACGTHPPTSPEQLQKMLGREICTRYRIENHDDGNAGALVTVGRFDGVDLAVNRHYVESDLRIITGLIEPHVFAGYSGGRKAVCPGLTSLAATMRLHAPDLVAHPNSRMGMLTGNPLHEALTRAAGKAGVDFMVNVTMNRDRTITGVFAGHYERALEAGVAFLDGRLRVYLEEPADVVVTSGSGFPLDGTLLQSLKGAMAATEIVKDRGTVILCAGARLGVGSTRILEIFETFGSWQGCLDRLRAGLPPLPEQWVAQTTCRLFSKAECLAYIPGVDEETVRKCWLTPVASPEEALRRALDRHGPRARVAVLPQGPYVLAELGSQDRHRHGLTPKLSDSSE